LSNKKKNVSENNQKFICKTEVPVEDSEEKGSGIK